LRHAKQRSLAPGIILKLVSDLEAVDGAPPVERYEFDGRHPHPQYVFSRKSVHGGSFPVAKKFLLSVARKTRLNNLPLEINAAKSGWRL
jgi:hypothetical protein